MDKEIINPFKCFPADRKFITPDKQFMFEYDTMTNTWTMYNDKVKIINMPNDDWFRVFMQEYVCTFDCYNGNAIRTNLRIKHEDGTIESKIFSLAKIAAYLYGIVDINSPLIAMFKNKIFYDEYGRAVQDVTRSNLSVPGVKYFLEDDQYIYFEIQNIDFFAKVDKPIKDYIINGCGNLIFSKEKGVRATEHGKGSSSNALGNIVFNFFGGNYDRKTGTKQINESIFHHPILNINFKDYSFSNLYSGSSIRTDDRYAYILLPRYGVEAVFDKWIYDNHKAEFDAQSWYIDSSDHIATNIITPERVINGVGLHRFIFKLLCNDYKIPFDFKNTDQIHHIDLNPLNNIIDNLYLCGLNRHRSIHNYINNPINNGLIDYEMLKKLDLKSNIIEVLTLGYIPDKYKETIKL